MEVPVLKKEDQYPLLNLEGGDARVTPMTQVHGANVTRKRPWYRRWPDVFSMSWILILIFGVASILVYAVMLYRPAVIMRHSMLFLPSNETKPGTEVFYHEIIPRGASVPLSLYTDYLHEMASVYPYLKFKVIFLLDDTIPTFIRGGKPNRSLGVPMACKQWYTYVGEMEKFVKNHDNIELNVMPLSSYMAMTPLKHGWRFLPKQDLIFYARIFSVWHFGGISLDLGIYNNKYNMHQRLDNRIISILRHHNDGWLSDEYDDMNIVEDEQETILTQYVLNLLSSLMNETRSLLEFNTTRPVIDQSNTRPLVRTHRNKRDISDSTEQIASKTTDTEITDTDTTHATATNPEITVVGTTDTAVEDSSSKTEILSTGNGDSPVSLMTSTDTSENGVQENRDTVTPITRNTSLIRVSKPFFLFYDISFRNLGSILPTNRREVRVLNDHSSKSIEANQYLTMDWAGTFVATPARQHPFLADLLTAGCRRMHAKLAIESVFMEQCYSFMSNAYCRYINFL